MLQHFSYIKSIIKTPSNWQTLFHLIYSFKDFFPQVFFNGYSQFGHFPLDLDTLVFQIDWMWHLICSTKMNKCIKLVVVFRHALIRVWNHSSMVIVELIYSVNDFEINEEGNVNPSPAAKKCTFIKVLIQKTVW